MDHLGKDKEHDTRADKYEKHIYNYDKEPENLYRHEAEYKDTNNRFKIEEIKDYGNITYISNINCFYDLAVSNPIVK